MERYHQAKYVADHREEIQTTLDLAQRAPDTTTGPQIISHGSTPSFSVGSPCVQPAAASGQFTAKYHNSHTGTTAGIPNSKFTPTTVRNHLRMRPVFTPRDRLHLLPQARIADRSPSERRSLPRADVLRYGDAVR
jgi:hypothetical protein